ncbi:DUF4190 domain-containing protein [Mycobacterium paraseoulense]|uniref:DUF4190 domain-containing protein n=1 Tax=Mycobacterium paraseoulense TaxID=590652 RepID=A0A1X0I8P7_9MYCO|nr:DUF4190 domain-containing protein [Mycobacterium paraseoulense]MCV7398066.1 DUF4190 domain-containing protein [Mycobacterium paraseoulense]ORB39250.1 hypothetical protein BST39_15835 [Mycobacterium paraseoulense]BBZ74398.1 hypothetical protein MPRS_54910 [Mycobacterium paraseoulense]
MIICQPSQLAAPARPVNPWAIAAFALSLVSWCGLPIPILSGALASVALRDMEQRGEGARAMAQSASAFAILVIAAIVVRGGHNDWLTKACW